MDYKIVQIMQTLASIGVVIFLFLAIVAMIVAMCDFIRYLYLLG